MPLLIEGLNTKIMKEVKMIITMDVDKNDKYIITHNFQEHVDALDYVSIHDYYGIEHGDDPIYDLLYDADLTLTPEALKSYDIEEEDKTDVYYESDLYSMLECVLFDRIARERGYTKITNKPKY